jgi:predicted GH43/DUF377 family glycosyl hydrolase
MKWRKLGRIYVANGKYEWAQTYAYIPTPYILDDGRIRVYTAFLDTDMVGKIGFVDLDADNLTRILRVSDKPVLDIGQPGTFDDSGVTPTCVIKIGGQTRLYYIGWQRGIRVRYFLFAGLAFSNQGGENFTRYSQVPILERSDGELMLRSAPCVIADEHVYKMWYIAGDSWIQVSDKQVPTYNMRYLESQDGINWGKEGKVCLEFSSEDEYGFGRPWVIKEGGIYKMWYSIRTKSKGYRIGYAESPDGLNWERKDSEVGIDVSDSGWDSEMIGMTSIVDIKGQRYMLYNGNNFGETGFGVAVLEG